MEPGALPPALSGPVPDRSRAGRPHLEPAPEAGGFAETVQTAQRPEDVPAVSPPEKGPETNTAPSAGLTEEASSSGSEGSSDAAQGATPPERSGPDILKPGASTGEIAELKRAVARELEAVMREAADTPQGPQSVETPAAAARTLKTFAAQIVDRLTRLDAHAQSALVPTLEAGMAQRAGAGEDVVALGSRAQLASDLTGLVAGILRVDLPAARSAEALAGAARAFRAGQTAAAGPGFLAALAALRASPGHPAADPGARGAASVLAPEPAGPFASDPGPLARFEALGPGPVPRGLAELSRPGGVEADGRALRQSVLAQIAEAGLSGLRRGARTHVELTPAGLGRLEIELDTSQAGLLRVVLRADNPMVLDALRTDRAGLADALAEQGLGGNGLSYEAFGGGRGDARGAAGEATAHAPADGAPETSAAPPDPRPPARTPAGALIIDIIA